MTAETDYGYNLAHSGSVEPSKIADRFPSAQRTPPPIVKRKSTRFSFSLSTETVFSSDDDHRCYGPYAHLRKKLDYTYHCHYVRERQWLQDSIIEDLLEECKSSNCPHPIQPWLVYVAGSQGAGKRFTMEELVKQDRFPLLAFVTVDPDEIRLRLPEFTTYLQKCPNRIDELTNKEAGYISEILALAALQAGLNVVWHGALADTEWHRHYFRQLRKEYTDLKVGLIHVKATKELTFQRAKLREAETGRTIPESCIETAMKGIPESVASVRPDVDVCFVIYNLEILQLEETTDWDTFRSTFRQTNAWTHSSSGKFIHTMSAQEQEQAETCSLKCNLKRRAKRFFVSQSSEQNHKADHQTFYGEYSHIRETLDYSYHSNYTFERQKLQDAIISQMLDAAVITDKNGIVCTTPTEPWIVFTAGAMGAGKGYTMNRLVEKGRFPLLAFVVVDPDEIRRHLPEFHLYVESKPELAGKMTRKEAGFIAEILTLAALQAGKNVMVDGSLRDAGWYKLYFQRLRHEFHNLRLSILYVTAPREAVFQRAAERALTTGRVVPRDVLIAALEQVPKSVEVLAPLVDYFAELENAPNVPDIQLKTPGETWETFQSQWIQTCAFVPGKHKALKLAKIAVEKATVTRPIL